MAAGGRYGGAMGDGVVGEVVDDAVVAVALGQPVSLVELLRRQVGMSYRRDGSALLVYSSGALVGRQQLAGDGLPVGPYEVFLHERSD